jgi:hypothetical protein
MVAAPALSSDGDTSTSTRLTNPRRLRLARILWAAGMLLHLAVFFLSLPQLRRGCICGQSIGYVDKQNNQIVLSPGPTSNGRIQQGDVLLALDGVTLAPDATPGDVVQQIDYQGDVGSTVTLTLQSDQGPPREVTLTRDYFWSWGVYDAVTVGFSLDGAVAYYIITELIVMVVAFGIALLIAWKRSDDWMALFAAWTICFLVADFHSVSILLDYPRYTTAIALYRTMVSALGFLFAFLFPDGRLRPRWLAIIPILYGVWQFAFSSNTPALDNISGLMFSAFAGVFVMVLVYRYRRWYTPLRRQQAKWVIVGAAVAILGNNLIDVLLWQVFPTDNTLIQAQRELVQTTLTPLLDLLIPITLAFAALRYRLYEIDLVINRGLVYGGVTALLGLLFGLIFWVAQTALTAILGASNTVLAAGVSAGIVVLLFNPARKRAQRFIDRRLYGLRFDLNEVAAAQKPDAILNPGVFTGRIIDSYQVLGVLGRGGMGEVYQGKADDGSLVAIKTLPLTLTDKEEFRTRFAREAQALAALSHPNIVRFYGSGMSQDVYYLAIELIDGQELTAYIREHAPLLVTEVQSLVEDIAAALDYAHGCGLVHRDIKPSNILLRRVDDGYQAVLTDFGIAKLADIRTSITGSGAIGTIDYMAPEQILSAALVDGRADLYALGIVVYEMLTGERPFKGGAGQVLFAHLQQPPPDPRDIHEAIPGAVSKAILKVLSKKPEDRFETAQAFALALKG